MVKFLNTNYLRLPNIKEHNHDMIVKHPVSCGILTARGPQALTVT